MMVSPWTWRPRFQARSVDVWRAALPAYERDLRDWRCPLAELEGRAANRRCNDISLSMDVITFRDMEMANTMRSTIRARMCR